MSATAKGSSPRIIAISMVKNEQDIIEPFIVHNMQFLDALIIIDNASTDATRQIIVDLMRQTEGVVLSDITGFEYVQHQRMTRLLHYCQTAYFADFVLFLDADEFIWAADRAAFVKSITMIPPGGYGLLPWSTFVLTPDTMPEAVADVPRSFRRRRTAETPQYFKAVLHAAGEPCIDLSIGQGNHSLHARSGESVPYIYLEEVQLAHFPVRGAAQIIGKSIIGWMAILARDPNWDGHSYQWRQIFDDICRGDLPEADRLCEASMRYAQDKAEIEWARDATAAALPTHYVRIHSSGLAAEPVALIARAWERTIVARQPLLSLSRPPACEAMNQVIAATALDGNWQWDTLFIDIPPLRWLAEKYQPESVLDIGCGTGAYLLLMRRFGAQRILGIDGIPAAVTAISADEYRESEISEKIELGQLFDLVLCTEVVEHIPDSDAETLLYNVARHAAKSILFSAAGPGQPGVGHINCRPIGEWLRRWQALGWAPDLTDTLGVRALATLSWFRRNLVVLKPIADETAESSIPVLEEIGNRPFLWYGQEPGTREELCSEDLPPQAGYDVPRSAGHADATQDSHRMLERADVINYFIRRFGYRRYLEIGVEAGNTFNRVEASEKFAVDPDFKIASDALHGAAFATTSDVFFDEHRDEIFDIVFIDGLHTFEQSLRDVARAMACIPRAGVILLDDCNPSDYLASIRDHGLCRSLKETAGYADRDWMGDVYKTVMFIHDYFANVSLAYIRETIGIVAIWMEPRSLMPLSRTVEDIARCDFAEFKGKVLPALPQRTLGEIGDAIFFYPGSRQTPPQ